MAIKDAAAMQAKLQAIWLKANEGEPVVINCKDVATARKLRWALYHVASVTRRRMETGQPVSQMLQQAVAEVEISISHAVVTVRRKAQSKLGEVLGELTLGQVGEPTPGAGTGAGEAPQSEEDRLIAESLAKLQAKLAEDAPKAIRSTPYYTRED